LLKELERGCITGQMQEGSGINVTFLEIGGKGGEMNLIAYLAPMHVYHSDLCPVGLGGYSNEEFAWCYSIPQSLQFRTSNNLLKFLAAIITPWIDILANHLQSGDYALLMTDSSTTEGWMCKTNFRASEEDQIQMDVRVKAAQKVCIGFHQAWHKKLQSIVSCQGKHRCGCPLLQQ
jgi:hypothetical protein